MLIVYKQQQLICNGKLINICDMAIICYTRGMNHDLSLNGKTKLLPSVRLEKPTNFTNIIYETENNQ